ncbi:MAG TPA: hypothetical protein V6D20_01915 [Candidatus Obscuribacterales bacterium]
MLDLHKGLVKGPDQLTEDVPTLAESSVVGAWEATPGASYDAETMAVTTTSTNHAVRAILGLSGAGSFEFSFLAKAGTLANPKFSVYSVTRSTNILAGVSYANQIDGAGYSRVRLQFSVDAAEDIYVYLVRDSGSTGTVFVDPASPEVRKLPGNHATASAAANKPIYRTDGTLHWLEFDGVDDFLEASFSLISQPILASVAWKDDVLNSGHIPFDGNDSTNRVLVQTRFSGELRAFAGTALDVAGEGSTSTMVSTVIADGPSSVFRKDGVQIGAADIGANGLSGIRIGRDGAGSIYLEGLVHGLVVRGAASTATEITKTDSYLAALAGVTL